MAELVDARDLKSLGAKLGTSSILVPGTNDIGWLGDPTRVPFFVERRASSQIPHKQNGLIVSQFGMIQVRVLQEHKGVKWAGPTLLSGSILEKNA